MKLNELFDDEFQKNLNQDLSKDDISDQDIDTNFRSPVAGFFKKLRYFIPVLNKCIDFEDENHFVIQKNDVFLFIIRNGSYHVSVSIYFREKSKVDLCILYQESDYRGDVIIKDITTGDTEYCYLTDFDNVTIEETIDILKNNFLPLLKRLGFNEDYSSNKNKNIERFN